MQKFHMGNKQAYRVVMQKDGLFQVIISNPNGIDQHVSNFKTENGAKEWAAAQIKRGSLAKLDQKSEKTTE